LLGICDWPTGASIADVRVKVSTSYYSIKGKTGEALNTSMLRGDGSRIKLSNAIAATETELDFAEPKIVVQDGRYVVKDVDVTLTVRYIFPSLKGQGGASKTVRQRWNEFWRELKRHEENHGEIGKAGVQRLEKALLGIRSFAVNGCAGFSRLASAKMKPDPKTDRSGSTQFRPSVIWRQQSNFTTSAHALQEPIVSFRSSFHLIHTYAAADFGWAVHSRDLLLSSLPKRAISSVNYALSRGNHVGIRRKIAR
jgi:predicted secreted Zn-dependent protease